MTNEKNRNAHPSLSRRDADLLHWFFERGDSLFFRSSFGPMLERQHAYGYGENGRRIPKTTRNADGVRVKVRRQLDEASFLPDEDDLLRAAEASRRLERVRAIDPDAARALRAYHGDVGARFAHLCCGRVVAVYPLTASGRAFLAYDPFSARSDPFERMAAEVAAQREAPTGERAFALARIHGEAEALLAKAWRFWTATGAARGRVA